MIYSNFQSMSQPFLKVKDFLGREASHIQKAFSPSDFTLKNPFSDRESAIRAVAAVALVAIGAIFIAADVALGIFCLPVAALFMVPISCAAIYLLATSILSEKATASSFSTPEVPVTEIRDPLEDEELVDEERLDSFQGVPPEMAQKIFNNLSLRDLAAIQGVCRSFYHLAKEQVILEKRKQLEEIIGSTAEIPDDQVDRYCAAAQNVKIYHPGLIKALGGLLEVERLPCLRLPRTQLHQSAELSLYFTLSNNHILFKSMNAPVMRGFDSLGRPFIAIKYRYNELDSPLPKTRVLVLFQTENIKEWEAVASYQDPDYSQESISEETPASLCLLDRISRLVKREPVGRLDDLDQEHNLRTLADGRSIVELADSN
ncbi:MAG: hypothetical protein K0S07_1457 [Chlamydiales bacterium]|jgi:hypothetical protein|nr:hypothetical protein [Chlamydiales bacterium]